MKSHCKKMLQKLMYSLQKFMYGRYGVDQLTVFLLLLGFVLGLFFGPIFWWLRLIAFLPYMFCLWRMFSKNIAARRRENEVFLKVWYPVRDFLVSAFRKIKNWLHFQKEAFANRKTYKYFTCPHCGQYLRAPRGKGKIVITCRGCRTEFVKKT